MSGYLDSARGCACVASLRSPISSTAVPVLCVAWLAADLDRSTGLISVRILCNISNSVLSSCSGNSTQFDVGLKHQTQDRVTGQ